MRITNEFSPRSWAGQYALLVSHGTRADTSITSARLLLRLGSKDSDELEAGDSVLRGVKSGKLIAVNKLQGAGMGFIDQDVPVPIGPVPPARSAGVEDLEGELATPPSEPRVNWLFSGVMFGAASWLLVLGVVFAIAGNRIIA